MDNSFLANLTTKPIPKKSHEYTLKFRNPTPILDVVTGDPPFVVGCSHLTFIDEDVELTR